MVNNNLIYGLFIANEMFFVKFIILKKADELSAFV